MVRHADPTDHSFRTSLLRAAGGGLVAMVITFGITAVLANVGREDGTGGPAVQSPPDVAAAETTQPPPTEDREPTEAATATEPLPTEVTTVTPDDPSDVTVQVLDTVGTGTGADAVAAADVLRDLGYDVIAVRANRRTVQTTTVLANPGYDDEANALRDTDERFAEVGPNDGFSDTADLHILVAAGFAD